MPLNDRMGSSEKTVTAYGEYTYAELEREPYWPSEKLRISITGAGGFIGSHIARRLKSEGHYIIASDWKKNEHMTEDMFCHEFHLVDLRVMDNCLKVTQGVDHVFNLAADMGGMGFIQSNHSVIMYNNTMISFNMLEAARINGVKRYPLYFLMWLENAAAASKNDILTCTSNLVDGVQLEFVMNLDTTYKQHFLCMLVFGKLWVQSAGRIFH
jgi:NAD(P)-dependent dehydrogenase (short-subunit alcohol dehydrogenase family)